MQIPASRVGIIIFHSLTRDDICKITDVQFSYLQKTLAKRKLSISLSQEAKELIAQTGYDPKYGAKPLKRVIQECIQNNLAKLVLPGIEDDFITIKIANDDMPFLIDSVIAIIKSHNLIICYYSNSINNIKRKDGLIDEIYSLEESNGVKESVIYVIIKGISDSFVDTLKESVQKTLKAVNCILKDWHLMLKKFDEAKSLLFAIEHPASNAGVTPGKDFLDWLKNSNFVFLGYQEYIADNDEKLVCDSKKDLGLRVGQSTLILSANLDSLYILRSDSPSAYIHELYRSKRI